MGIVFVPYNFVILVEVGSFIRDLNGRICLHNLMPTESPPVTGDPKGGIWRRYAWLKIGCAHLLFSVIDRGNVAPHFSTHRREIFVHVRVEPFPECQDSRAALVVDFVDFGLGILLVQKNLFFGVERPWQECVQRRESFVEGDVGQDVANEEEHHNDYRADGTFDGKQANHTDLGEVETSQQVLQRARIDQPLGINLDIVNEEKVIPVGLVDKVQTDESKAQDQWRDT